MEYWLRLEPRTTDNLENVGGGGLLLQRLAQFVEQARVLDGDDRLGGEVRNELDLLVRKWPDFGAVDDEGTNQLVLPPHGHADERASASVLGRRPRVAFYRCVGTLDELLCLQKAIEGSSGNRQKRPALPEVLGICRWYAQRSRHVECAVITIEHTKLGLADRDGMFQHRLKHRLQLSRRTRNDTQHFGGGGLLLQRFSEIGRALVQFAQ